jgi:2',3'-cyclic-nucleotide 2'-phosphodiesterase (5'-nucleotidase family)
LRNTDRVDLVVALSHSGINGQGQGEDALLATMVPGIDVIVSGHTHDKLMAPAVVGKTIIVTAGAYGEYLGRLDLTISRSGGVVTSVAVQDYKLLPINDSTPGNAAIQTSIDNGIQLLDAALMPFNLAYKKVIAETSFDLPRAAFKEFGLGNLITDAYLATTKALQPADDQPVIAVEANGSIRTHVLKGKTGAVLFADLYRVTPLGIGPDGQPNYPLVTYYLSGRDLKSGLEVAAGANSPALNDDAYFMQFAGMEVDYNMAGMLFNRVTGARVVPGGGAAKIAIDFTNTTTCYKVVTSIYLAGLFNLVGTVSNGLLPAIEAKQKDCLTRVTDFTSRIVDSNPATVPVEELKQYQAVVGYVGQLPDSDADMIPNIPAAYQGPAVPPRIKQTP